MEELNPSFPLSCAFCEATHSGGVEKAIDDGWNFGVFDTRSEGIVQMAGCPNHKYGFTCIWCQKVYNTLKSKLRGKNMPYFPLIDWNGYKLQLSPASRKRNLIANMRLPALPFFYGTRLDFHLELTPLIPQDAITPFKFEWVLCNSKDEKADIKSDDTKPTGEYIFKYSKGKFNKWLSSFRNKFDGDVERTSTKLFTKYRAVKLGTISVLDQYKIRMRFTDNGGNISKYYTAAEFTVEDRDHYSLNVWALLIGAVFGALFSLAVAIFLIAMGVGSKGGTGTGG